eukprot:gene20694-27493_t
MRYKPRRYKGHRDSQRDRVQKRHSKMDQAMSDSIVDTTDAAQLCWSADDASLAVLDGSLYYKIQDRQCKLKQAAWNTDPRDCQYDGRNDTDSQIGVHVASYCAYKDALGAKHVASYCAYSDAFGAKHVASYCTYKDALGAKHVASYCAYKDALGAKHVASYCAYKDALGAKHVASYCAYSDALGAKHVASYCTYKDALGAKHVASYCAYKDALGAKHVASYCAYSDAFGAKHVASYCAYKDALGAKHVASYCAYKDALGAKHVASYCAYSDALGAKHVASYCAYSDALGAKCAAWNGSGEMLAQVRILNHVTWEPLLEGKHPQKLEAEEAVAVYREEEERAGGSSPSKINTTKQSKSKYVIADMPTSLPYVQPLLDKPNPKMGVGTSRVYMWTPAGASIVHIPLKNFCAQGIKWEPRKGSSFVLTDAAAFCCAYLSNE